MMFVYVWWTCKATLKFNETFYKLEKTAPFTAISGITSDTFLYIRTLTTESRYFDLIANLFAGLTFFPLFNNEIPSRERSKVWILYHCCYFIGRFTKIMVHLSEEINFTTGHKRSGICFEWWFAMLPTCRGQRACETMQKPTLQGKIIA